MGQGAFVVTDPQPICGQIKHRLRVSTVPTGKVKWYDVDKGFGVLSQESGEDVYVRSSALPAGVEGLKPGQKVEFGIIEGRKGEQALSVRVIDAPPSLSKAQRKKPEQMAIITEDLIKLLDGLGNGYRHGRHPEAKSAKQVALMLRKVADELEL